MGQQWTRAQWSEFLTSELQRPVAVAFGRSRSVPVSAQRSTPDLADQLTLRLHEAFREAPQEVRMATARWLRSGRRARRACSVLDAWIEENIAQLPAPPPDPHTLRVAGDCHHLRELAEPLFGTVFGDDFDGERSRPLITWGRRSRSLTRRSLRLGSYDPGTHLVRVHPVLDQAGVPPWFVRYILMHEILHAAIPPRKGENGRWVHHGPLFQARERAYADYGRALAWEESNLPGLIRSARRGTTFRPVGGAGLAGRARRALERWTQGEFF